MRPTLRGLGAAAAFALLVALAITTDTPELAPLAVVIGVPLFIAPWLAYRRARRARESAEFHAHVEPAAVPVGSAMEVVFFLTNRATRGGGLPPLGVSPVERHWLARGSAPRGHARHLRLAPPEASLVALPSPRTGHTLSSRLPVPTGHRGVFELPPLRCWAHDPFGLFGSPGPTTPAVHAVVHPFPRDPGQPIGGLGAARAGEEAAHGSSSGGGLGDLEGIRPYVAGDRLSLLHWPAKARYGTWFVRQFRGDGVAAVPLVLDDRAGVHRKADFERLVSTMSWALDEALGGGRPVLFLTLSGRSFTLEPSDRGRAAAWLVLAEVQPLPAPSAWVPSIPAGSVILTTRTGAERLARSARPAANLGNGGGRGTTRVAETQVIVV
jgi:uncharacterized protein (DUF58 family)